MLGEHVLKMEISSDREIFEQVWTRQIGNPRAFWPRFPIPSGAIDDPLFNKSLPANSWNGASQALTALRAPRWMPHYGLQEELTTLMQQWVQAIVQPSVNGGRFLEQMNPSTGEFLRGSSDGYTPSALVYLDFMTRLRKMACPA